MSELHSRLSHLVNYSSQLIFVSSDSITDQQKTLNSFLATQADDTEVSFFKANSKKTTQDYRSIVCRQLGGHQVGSFVRPLHELLADLSSHKDAFLLCITQADLLPDAFLQELWDWVIDSQSENKTLHINVILFGESVWAEKTKEWLPKQNSHKPVLLSSSSIDPIGFDVNALESLMAQDANWFTKSSAPLMTKAWFISTMLAVFFVVFVGMITWQYPHEVQKVLAGDFASPDEIPAFDFDDGKATAAVTIQTTDRAELTPYRSQLELVSPKDTPFFASDWPTPRSQDTDGPSLAKTESLFDNEIAAERPELENAEAPYTKLETAELENTESQINLSYSDKTAMENGISEDSLPVSKNASPSLGLSSTTLASTSSTSSSLPSSGDFQVPDIISVEQLDATFNEKTDQLTSIPNASSMINNSSTFASSTQKEQNTSNNANNKAVLTPSAIDYRFDETTLLSMSSDKIVLQLSGIQNPTVLENYLDSNKLRSSTWVYETQRYGGAWYVVLYKQSFDSIDQALSLLSTLPEDVQDAQPFAKSVNQIKQEIKRQ